MSGRPRRTCSTSRPEQPSTSYGSVTGSWKSPAGRRERPPLQGRWHHRLQHDGFANSIKSAGEPRSLADNQAVRDGLSHQQFQHRLIAEQADRRHEHSIAHRIREARIRERQPLRAFDWEFNRSAIDRVQIEELATGAFIARQDKLVFVVQSGVGKSFLSQAIAEAACVRGYSVLYTTSAALLMDLIPSLSDQRLPQGVRYYGRFDPLVLYEFGFEKI